MKTFEQLRFRNSYATLGEDFFATVSPTPLESTHLISFSHSVAELLELDPAEFQRADAADILSGKKRLPGSRPLAMLYAGHQFGHFVPQLGDGRAIMLGEILTSGNRPWELQLKGAGLTPFSRDGDGRAVLRSTLREYLCSEAMAGLGIPTTRALCMLGSEEEVYREQIETGALLLRVAPSHVRFGSFEVFYYRHQYHHLKTLADYMIDVHYPELRQTEHPYEAFFREVVLKTARLMAQWQLVGFAHGVMNTDNMSVLGVTLDYGPFGFLDTYDPGYVCNHSDYQGRYAFEAQPQIGLWNLTCFAQALLPLFDPDDGEAAAAMAQTVLKEYEPELVREYAAGMRAKLGLRQARDEDQVLVQDFLSLMQAGRMDYTRTFRQLSNTDFADEAGVQAFRDNFVDRPGIEQWLARYRQRLQQENSVDSVRCQAMRQVNPNYILRNYLAQNAIEKAQQGDYTDIETLMKLLSSPFEEHPEYQAYSEPPPAGIQQVAISCSS